MRLAYTHAYSWPDVRRGGERLLHELSAGMAARGHDVTVFTAGPTARRELVEDVDVVVLRQRRRAGRGHELDFAARVLPRLRSGAFDAVHSLGLDDAIASIWARRIGATHRTIYTNLGLPLRAGEAAQPLRSHAYVMNQVDVYGCLSRYALAILESEWHRTGQVTPGGVRLSAFTPGRRAPAPTILFAGALTVPRKGLRVLLQALPAVAASEPELQLWLTGPGDAAAAVADAPAAARNRITVLPLGTPADVARHYAAAWVTAVPGSFEAFGLVALESLACGTPAVVADDAGLPELIDVGTGVTVPPGDPDALAGALIKACALAREPGIADRCRAAAAPYDWVSGVGPRYEELYAGG